MRWERVERNGICISNGVYGMVVNLTWLESGVAWHGYSIDLSQCA